MMNAGALIAVFVTPILRDDVECFGDSSCFTLAFGVNGAIMLVALGNSIDSFNITNRFNGFSISGVCCWQTLV